MPDDPSIKITIEAEDDLTPVLQKITAEIDALSSVASKAGQQLVADLKGLGISLKDAFPGLESRDKVNVVEFLKTIEGAGPAFQEVWDRAGGRQRAVLEEGKKAIKDFLRDPENFVPTTLGVEGVRAINDKVKADQEEVQRSYLEDQAQRYEHEDELASKKKADEEEYRRSYLEGQAQQYAWDDEQYVNSFVKKKEEQDEYRRSYLEGMAQQYEHEDNLAEEMEKKKKEEQEETRRSYLEGLAQQYEWEDEQAAKRKEIEEKKPKPTFFEEARAGRAAGGGLMGRFVQDLTWGAESFFRYMIVWRTLETVMEKVGGAVQTVGNEFNAFNQVNAATGEGVQNSISNLVLLNASAIATGSSIQQLTKDFVALYSSGFSQTSARGVAQAIESIKGATGVDLTDIVSRASMYQATAQDMLKASAAGVPGLRRPGLEWQQAEITASMERLAAQRSHTVQERRTEDMRRSQAQYFRDLHEMQEYSMEDQHHATEKATQESHLAISRDMEDRHHFINVEMEERHHATNIEMEERHYMRSRDLEEAHRTIDREMQDRHRLASQQEADMDRLASRRMGFYESMPGAMEVLQGKWSKSPTAYAAAAFLQPEMEKGYAEIQKEGMSPELGRMAVQGGMSPGVILGFAEAARQEERIVSQRERETEEIKKQRKEQDQNLTEAMSQHDEEHQKQLAQYDEEHKKQLDMYEDERKTARSLQDDEISKRESMYQEELKQRRDIHQVDKDLSDSVIEDRVNKERAFEDQQAIAEVKLLALRIRGNELLEKQTEDHMNRVNKMMSMIPSQTLALFGIIGAPPYQPIQPSPQQTNLSDKMTDVLNKIEKSTSDSNEKSGKLIDVLLQAFSSS